MTNEEFQKIVLKELRTLNEKVDKLEQRQTKLEQGQIKLEQGQEVIKRDLRAVIDQTADLTEFRQEMKNQVSDMKSTITKVEIATADNWSDIAKIKALILA